MTVSQEPEGRLDHQHHRARELYSFNSFTPPPLPVLWILGALWVIKPFHLPRSIWPFVAIWFKLSSFRCLRFFLHPISLPPPSLICVPSVSSSLLSALLYIHYISHFLYPRSINNWWSIFDLLAVVKGQTQASENTINTGVQVPPLLMLSVSHT